MAQSIKLGSDVYIDPSGVANSVYNLGANNFVEKSTDLSDSYFSVHALYFARYGLLKGVYLNILPTSSFPIATDTIIATIPALYRPANNAFFTVSGQSISESALLSVKTNGDLSLYINVSGDRSFIRGWWWYI